MTSKTVDHWVTSPYCFCKELPWLVLSGIPAAPAVLAGGWGWEDWAILAASLIALALFLFLLFLLLCLLCPGGLCCGPGGLCCGGVKDDKKKMGLSSAQAVEMSSFGGSQDSNLTAVDLKLPRAWMDASKGDTIDERGEIGMGLGTFGNHKTWTSLNGDASGRMANRSASFGNHRGRSEYHSARSRNNNNRLDQDYHDGSANDSARLDYYRNQSAATIMTPKSTGNLRDAVQEWQRKSTTATRRLVENRQTRTRGEEGVDNAGFQAQELSPCRGGGGGQDSKVYEAKQSLDTAYSSVHDSSQNDPCGVGAGGNNMALVKASASGSGSTNAVTTSGGEGTPVVQCYTVTKKVTTTTYGDDEGDEETSVVTSTEKKWREGMNEVGEISMSASASAGELLPSIGAPSAVLSDTSNVRTVKSLTNVEGGASNIVRRYEYQQARNETDTHVGSTLLTTRIVSDTLL